MVTHHLAVVDHMCDRFAVMLRGKITEILPREARRFAPQLVLFTSTTEVIKRRVRCVDKQFGNLRVSKSKPG
jgi:ABC-type dipeptide/oligopeptide/nickel transport system ATPase subunit